MILSRVHRQLLRLAETQRSTKSVKVTEYTFNRMSTMDKNIDHINKQVIHPDKQDVLDIIESHRHDYEEAVRKISEAKIIRD